MSGYGFCENLSVVFKHASKTAEALCRVVFS
jgi:hypothetical protein